MSAAKQEGRVLVTGANGFVGRAVVARLERAGVAVTAAVRSAARSSLLPTRLVSTSAIGNIDGDTDWGLALEGVETVIHCAARVHVLSETAANPLAAFRVTNVEGSIALARQAARAGVRRFVNVSSIKVNGESTELGAPFRASDPPRPVDPYGISKLESELALTEISRASDMELVIVRPPLVYGPGVKANFLSMARWIARGVPLPFGRLLANRRSFVALENLVDLIDVCSRHPGASGRVFLVSDNDDLSTAELLRRTARALDVPARLLPVPPSLLRASAMIVGRSDLWQRLGGTLQVDISESRAILNWTPPVSVDEGLRTAVAGLVRSRK